MKAELRYTFGKTEKLKGRKLIGQLFTEGNSFFIAPIKVLWLDTVFAGHNPVKLLITVPRRNFKNAADRNRIRRLLSEAYRLHKHDLHQTLTKLGLQCVVAFVMTGRSMPQYYEAEQIIIMVLQRLQKEHEKIAG